MITSTDKFYFGISWIIFGLLIATFNLILAYKQKDLTSTDIFSSICFIGIGYLFVPMCVFEVWKNWYVDYVKWMYNEPDGNGVFYKIVKNIPVESVRVQDAGKTAYIDKNCGIPLAKNQWVRISKKEYMDAKRKCNKE